MNDHESKIQRKLSTISLKPWSSEFEKELTFGDKLFLRIK